MYRTTAAQHGEGSGYTRKTESIWGILEGIRRGWRKMDGDIAGSSRGDLLRRLSVGCRESGERRSREMRSSLAVKGDQSITRFGQITALSRLDCSCSVVWEKTKGKGKEEYIYRTSALTLYLYHHGRKTALFFSFFSSLSAQGLLVEDDHLHSRCEHWIDLAQHFAYRTGEIDCGRRKT